MSVSVLVQRSDSIFLQFCTVKFITPPTLSHLPAQRDPLSCFGSGATPAAYYGKEEAISAAHSARVLLW
jgi:hypothetical protein